SGLVGLRRMTTAGGTRLDTVGGTVHLAAALQKNAPPGGILISARTIDLCRTQLQLVPCERPALSALSLRAYLPDGPPIRRSRNVALHGYRQPMVGRVLERETLREALTRSGAQNRTIAIVGEPGVGKSRLMESA